MVRSLCFPIMPLYLGFMKSLSLQFYLANHRHSLYSLSWLAGPRYAPQWQVTSVRADWLFVSYALTRLWMTTKCLQALPSIGSSSSWDGPVYSAATFPATVWSQFKLDREKRERQQTKIKCDPEQKQGEEAAAELLPSKSHATVKVSLLAKVTNCSFKFVLWRANTLVMLG